MGGFRVWGGLGFRVEGFRDGGGFRVWGLLGRIHVP